MKVQKNSHVAPKTRIETPRPQKIYENRWRSNPLFLNHVPKLSESGLANDILEQRANFTVLFQKEIEVRHGYR